MQERLTHKRSNGIKDGYWSPNKKQELVDCLAKYEDTGLSPEEIKARCKISPAGGKIREIPTITPEDEFQKYLGDVQELIDTWKNDGLGYISIKCQLSDLLCGIKDEDMVFTIGQIKRTMLWPEIKNEHPHEPASSGALVIRQLNYNE